MCCEIESRVNHVQEAVEQFRAGFFRSKAVVAVFAIELGLDAKQP